MKGYCLSIFCSVWRCGIEKNAVWLLCYITFCSTRAPNQYLIQNIQVLDQNPYSGPVHTCYGFLHLVVFTVHKEKQSPACPWRSRYKLTQLVVPLICGHNIFSSVLSHEFCELRHIILWLNLWTLNLILIPSMSPGRFTVEVVQIHSSAK